MVSGLNINLAMMQYRYGLKSRPFILIISEKYTTVVTTVLNSLTIKHKVSEKEGNSIKYIIYSSESKNNRLAKSLRSIPF